MERDGTAEFVSKYFNISTHTLTWSVTTMPKLTKLTESISTHTLTWSVTKRVVDCKELTKFQLTRSRGA